MVFGIQKLQNDIFCITEERDYFQGKFLEQVSELASLKEELRLARREISKLREEVMHASVSRMTLLGEAGGRGGVEMMENEDDASTLTSEGGGSVGKVDCHHHEELVVHEEASKAVDPPLSDEQEEALSHNEPTEEEEEDDDDDNHSAKDIRQSAEKLLQWASYRSTARTVASTPEHSSIASPSSVPALLESALEEEDSSPRRRNPKLDLAIESS